MKMHKKIFSVFFQYISCLKQSKDVDAEKFHYIYTSVSNYFFNSRFTKIFSLWKQYIGKNFQLKKNSEKLFLIFSPSCIFLLKKNRKILLVFFFTKFSMKVSPSRKVKQTYCFEPRFEYYSFSLQKYSCENEPSKWFVFTQLNFSRAFENNARVLFSENLINSDDFKLNDYFIHSTWSLLKIFFHNFLCFLTKRLIIYELENWYLKRSWRKKAERQQKISIHRFHMNQIFRACQTLKLSQPRLIDNP